MKFFDFFKKKNSKPNLEEVFREKKSEKAIMQIDKWLNEISECGQNLSKLNFSQQIVIIIKNLDREINNAGFNQFYFNSCGNHANETVQYLKKIGANKTSEIVQKANSEWPNQNVPKDKIERQTILKTIEEKAGGVWKDCNHEFYKYNDDIAELLMDFVKKNQADFK